MIDKTNKIIFHIERIDDEGFPDEVFYTSPYDLDIEKLVEIYKNIAYWLTFSPEQINALFQNNCDICEDMHNDCEYCEYKNKEEE